MVYNDNSYTKSMVLWLGWVNLAVRTTSLPLSAVLQYLEHEREWDPLVEGGVWGVCGGEVERVSPGEDGVDDAADVALELGADVERRVDPAVVVHHLRAHAGRGLSEDARKRESGYEYCKNDT